MVFMQNVDLIMLDDVDIVAVARKTSLRKNTDGNTTSEKEVAPDVHFSVELDMIRDECKAV